MRPYYSRVGVLLLIVVMAAGCGGGGSSGANQLKIQKAVMEAQIAVYFEDPANAFTTTTGAPRRAQIAINACSGTGGVYQGKPIYDCAISITGVRVRDGYFNLVDASNLHVCFIFPAGPEAYEVNPNTSSGAAASACPKTLIWLGDTGPFEYDHG